MTAATDCCHDRSPVEHHACNFLKLKLGKRHRRIYTSIVRFGLRRATQRGRKQALNRYAFGESIDHEFMSETLQKSAVGLQIQAIIEQNRELFAKAGVVSTEVGYLFKKRLDHTRAGYASL